MVRSGAHGGSEESEDHASEYSHEFVSDTHPARITTKRVHHAGKIARDLSASPSPRKQSKSRRVGHPDPIPYRELLNSYIDEINNGDTGQCSGLLYASQLGCSSWTAAEKGALFAQLSRYGPGEVRKLAHAIETKSEPEVVAFLQLLQAGAREWEMTSKPKEPFTAADSPAAAEIGADCEKGLNAEAMAFSLRVEDAEARLEQRKHGEWWRVDEESAHKLELLIEASMSDAVALTATKDNAADFSVPIAFIPSTSKPDDDLPVPAAGLLKPSVFVQLSQSVFMNSARDPDSNWHNLLSPNDILSSPAILRTAFDDFHNLVVSVTRRLVQTSIFQATSRLRATTDERVAPNVYGNDVRAALSVLGMPANSRKYWATAARRCHVDVYSEATQYKHGRPSTKVGAKLTLQEVEHALGLPAPVDPDNADLSAPDDDSDAYTSISIDLQHSDAASGIKSEENDEIEVHELRKPNFAKRRRALSPHSYDRADDRFLEELDRLGSLAEENRLREVIGLATVPVPAEHGLQRTFKRKKMDAPAAGWRDGAQFAAAWAIRDGQPAARAFEKMGALGIARRRKRKERRWAAERRELADHEPGDELDVSGDVESSQSSPVATEEEYEETDEEGDEEEDEEGGEEEESYKSASISNWPL